MRKPIFESEEEVREFFEDSVSASVCNLFKLKEDICLSIMHRKGYIKKSSLETARENYRKHVALVMHDDAWIYIQELEKEIERLKKER